MFGWNWQLVERLIITIAPMLVQYFSRLSAGCVAKRFMEWLGTLGGVQVGGVRSVPRLTAPATTAAFPRIDGMKVGLLCRRSESSTLGCASLHGLLPLQDRRVCLCCSVGAKCNMIFQPRQVYTLGSDVVLAGSAGYPTL